MAISFNKSLEVSTRLHGLDHLRASAILLVLIFHYKVYYGVPEWLDTFSSFGWSGVDLFFVLSGYLIGSKLLKEIDHTDKIDFTGFYWNRFFRILPAYFVTLLLYFSVTEVQEGRALQPLWKFLTFTQNINIDLYANTFSHAWSLSVEEYFYLLLPLLLFLIFQFKLQRKAVYIFIALLIAGIAVRYFLWTEYVDPMSGRMRLGNALKYIYYPTYTRLDGLGVGVAIAAMSVNKSAVLALLFRYGNSCLVFACMLLFASYMSFGGSVLSPNFSTLFTTLFGFPLLSVAYGFLVVAALSPTCFLYKFRFWPSSFLATLAYSIYLVHKMTNHWINTQLKTLIDLEKGPLFVLCLLAAIGGALVLHLVVEKPFLMFRDRYRRILSPS